MINSFSPHIGKVSAPFIMILLRWRDRGWKKKISDDAAEFEMPVKKEADDVKAANLSLESVMSHGEIDVEKD